MIISGYGVELHRLKDREDVELLRQWRNSTHINRFMEFRGHISEAQQAAWFEQINTVSNNYMVIACAGKKVGIIHGAEIDWKKKQTGSGGIFIWDESAWMTKTPLAASMLMTDMSSFYGLKQTFIKILKENTSAIAFNTSLGYRELEAQQTATCRHFVLDQSTYERKRETIVLNVLQEFEPVEISILLDHSDAVDRFYYEQFQAGNQVTHLDVIENSRELIRVSFPAKSHRPA